MRSLISQILFAICLCFICALGETIRAADAPAAAPAGKAGTDWWSLKPLSEPPLPAVKDANWARNPIDHFILARLEAAGLAPAPQADRLTLIRRITFDLTGLPPAPAEIDTFRRDDAPDAYERLVDRLLASPAYGERWARHWLDIVRFGESHGFERDQLRETAWRYRDWVIEAMNDDLPYDQFVRQQIAGDVLTPDDPQAIIATGFLVAAPFDEVGHKQQSEPQRDVVRADELEDLVGTVSQTFLGLTANCARCHDHKFDPIPQADFYRLASALSGVNQGERETLSDGAKVAIASRTDALTAKAKDLRKQIQALEEPARARLHSLREKENVAAVLPAPIARWEFEGDLRDSIGSLHGEAHGGATVAGGKLMLDGKGACVTTAPLAARLEAKTLEAWVSLATLDQSGGGVMGVQTLDGALFDAMVFGERDPRQWMAGSNGFARWQGFSAPPEDAKPDRFVHIAIVWNADRSITAYRDGKPYGVAYKAKAVQDFSPGQSQVIFGLRHSPAGANKMLAGSIDRAQLYDHALSAEEIARSAGVADQSVSAEELLGAFTDADRTQWRALRAALSENESRLGLLAGGKTYAAVASQPAAPMRVHNRGQPSQPKEVVSPGGLSGFDAVLSSDFALAPDAPEGLRRLKLADWIADPRNPLTPRVIANRLWHYHFGVGIVETPNDFGFNGGRPSHPELLDWLATQLQRDRWSLKKLHRTILLSATYCQSARPLPAAARIDADNRLLWRKSPTRLEAEAVRDAILSCAGQLNCARGGPGYRDFSIRINNSTFYDPIDAVGDAFNRRSVYRTVVRSGTSKFLDVFDCPDPSTLTPRRVVTTTPLQALSLLNNSFVLRMSDAMAKRLLRDAGDDVSRQIERAYRIAFGRDPQPQETASAVNFVRKFGLASFCRVLFNSNEFVYVN